MLREFCDFRRGKCERQCGFGILRVESAKAVQNLGIFRGKCEMLTEPGIFCGENTKCRAGLSIFCPERTKIRSGFAILSLAAAKSPYHTFQTAARFPEFEGAAVIDSVSANFRHRNQLLRPVHSQREPFRAKPETVPQARWAFRSSACCSVRKRGRRFHGLQSKTFWLIRGQPKQH